MSISQKQRETVLWHSIQNQRHMTFEEMLVWESLCFILKPIAINIFSQEIIYNFNIEKFYILDFLVLPFGIVIEIDGSQHNSNIEYDSRRDDFLDSLGLYVIRFDNEIVRNNLREVIVTILKAIGYRVDYKLSQRFWEWHQACRNKQKEIMSSFTHEDFKQLKNLNKQYRIKQTFLKAKTQFDRNYVYQMSKEIKKQMFLNIK